MPACLDFGDLIARNDAAWYGRATVIILTVWRAGPVMKFQNRILQGTGHTVLCQPRPDRPDDHFLGRVSLNNDAADKHVIARAHGQPRGNVFRSAGNLLEECKRRGGSA